MRHPIAPLLMLVALVPACLEDPENESSQLQADSAALDISDEEDAPDDLDLDLDSDPSDEPSPSDDDASFDPDAEVDGLTMEPDATNACVNCYTNTYSSFHSWGCNYASCYPGDWDLGCFNGIRTCLEQICFVQGATGSIDAAPETVYISSGLGTTNVSWSGCASTNEVWVSVDGAAETLFARDQSGSQSATWIQVGHTYDFCLYEGTSHANQLDCVRVTGQYQAPPPPPPSCFQTGCPSGRHCCGDACVPNGMECP